MIATTKSICKARKITNLYSPPCLVLATVHHTYNAINRYLSQEQKLKKTVADNYGGDDAILHWFCKLFDCCWSKQIVSKSICFHLTYFMFILPFRYVFVLLFFPVCFFVMPFFARDLRSAENHVRNDNSRIANSYLTANLFAIR